MIPGIRECLGYIVAGVAALFMLALIVLVVIPLRALNWLWRAVRRSL
jgi:hypothetical protein